MEVGARWVEGLDGMQRNSRVGNVRLDMCFGRLRGGAGCRTVPPVSAAGTARRLVSGEVSPFSTSESSNSALERCGFSPLFMG